MPAPPMLGRETIGISSWQWRGFQQHLFRVDGESSQHLWSWQLHQDSTVSGDSGSSVRWVLWFRSFSWMFSFLI